MAENYVSTNMETGVQVREALTKIESYQPDLFAWTEIGDSITVNLKSPTTYSGITDPGDYVIYKFSNGPSRIPSTLSPILLSLRDGKKYVSANGAIYTLNSAGDSWVSIDEAVDDDTILYVKSDTAPTRTNNTFWFDTSHYNGTSDGYIDLKYYDTNSSSWISVFNGDNYLKKSVLDPDGKNTDIYTYITEKVAAVVGEYSEFIKHKANKLTLIHITASERTQYAKIINESELRALINNTYKPAIKQTVEDSVSTELDTTQISADSTTLDNSYKSHLANHITADNIASWKNKAEADHRHDYTTGDTKLQASQIVSGTFGADQLPDEIKERYYEITTSPDSEFGNTSITDAQRKAKYHNGNAFYYKTTDETTGENIRKWYRIIDSTKIGTSSWADGIIDFTGKEANMDWSNITGRPTTLEEFGITTDLYTKTQVDEKFNTITTQVESMNTVLADCEGDTGYEYGNDINWTETNSGLSSRYWQSVCYGNDKYVTVAINTNYSAYSTDGINWTESTISGTSRNWYSVCYGNGKYVAIANDSNYFAYSTDGITWTESTISGTSRNWPSVCYGNGKYVAVSKSNYFAYSTDGINWTESTISSTSRNWYSVCYGNDKYVAIAWNSNTFAYSTDGINWTEGTISSTSRDWYSVCYGNGKYVAVAFDSNYFAYSTDGINWTESTISGTSRNWPSVCYGNGKYVAVAYKSNYFAYSTDHYNYNIIADDNTQENSIVDISKSTSIKGNPSNISEGFITYDHTNSSIYGVIPFGNIIAPQILKDAIQTDQVKFIIKKYKDGYRNDQFYRYLTFTTNRTSYIGITNDMMHFTVYNITGSYAFRDGVILMHIPEKDAVAMITRHPITTDIITIDGNDTENMTDYSKPYYRLIELPFLKKYYKYSGKHVQNVKLGISTYIDADSPVVDPLTDNTLIVTVFNKIYSIGIPNWVSNNLNAQNNKRFNPVFKVESTKSDAAIGMQKSTIFTTYGNNSNTIIADCITTRNTITTNILNYDFDNPEYDKPANESNTIMTNMMRYGFNIIGNNNNEINEMTVAQIEEMSASEVDNTIIEDEPDNVIYPVTSYNPNA